MITAKWIWLRYKLVSVLFFSFSTRYRTLWQTDCKHWSQIQSAIHMTARHIKKYKCDEFLEHLFCQGLYNSAISWALYASQLLLLLLLLQLLVLSKSTQSKIVLFQFKCGNNISQLWRSRKNRQNSSFCIVHALFTVLFQSSRNWMFRF